MAILKRKSGETEAEAEMEIGDLRATLDPGGEPTRKTPSSRRLLLLILLLVLGGAGYVYLVGLPDTSPPPPPAAPKKQPIAMPIKPPTEPAAVTAANSEPEKSTGRAASAPAQVIAGPPVVLPAQPSPDKVVPEPAPAAKPDTDLTTKSEPDPVQAAVAEKAPEAVKPVAKPAGEAGKATTAAPAVAAGKYLVEAGVYLLPGSRLQAEKAIRRLGYEPRSAPVKREVEMTRLLVGVFPAREAEQRLQEIAVLAPDAFVLPRGEGTLALYAGSYFTLDKARSFADRLFQKEIRVEEESARVPMTLRQVIFGNFPDQASAGEAASKAKAAGMEAVVIRK